ncbi:MAG: DNA polymerase ligase N-terminal domain-containing protein [Thermodesulfovibrionales bacterium]
MPLFVVHEHHATHLHFDLRLEMDGVLKSWAVPKGPSMNPADRRLAIMVDDHDLEYATFEGTIPEGSYGAGRVLIWDTGDYEVLSGNLDAGRIEVAFHGKKLKGAFALFRMKGKDKEWLLVKKTEAGAERPSGAARSASFRQGRKPR